MIGVKLYSMQSSLACAFCVRNVSSPYMSFQQNYTRKVQIPSADLSISRAAAAVMAVGR